MKEYICYCSLFDELISTFCTSEVPLQDFTSVLYVDRAVFLEVFKVVLRAIIEVLYVFQAVEIADLTSDLVDLSHAASTDVFLVVKVIRLVF